MLFYQFQLSPFPWASWSRCLLLKKYWRSSRMVKEFRKEIPRVICWDGGYRNQSIKPTYTGGPFPAAADEIVLVPKRETWISPPCLSKWLDFMEEIYFHMDIGNEECWSAWIGREAFAQLDLNFKESLMECLNETLLPLAPQGRVYASCVIWSPILVEVLGTKNTSNLLFRFESLFGWCHLCSV